MRVHAVRATVNAATVHQTYLHAILMRTNGDRMLDYAICGEYHWKDVQTLVIHLHHCQHVCTGGLVVQTTEPLM